MKPYDFKKVFIKYSILLSSLLLFIYGAVFVVFNWQMDEEMREVAYKEWKSIHLALDDKQQINPGHPYFIVKNHKIILNETAYANKQLNDAIIKENQSSFMWKTNGNHLQVESGLLNNGRTLYSLTDMTDYEETKTLLFNILTGLMFLTFLLSIGTAYYIAVKPIRVYEKMLKQHKEFIQDASHEMKTPLAAISLGVDYIKALDGTNISDHSKNSLNKIKEEIQYVQSLISNILQTETSEEIKSVDVARILDGVIEQQKQLNNVDIIRVYNQPLNYQISEVLLKQMMTLLIDNAIKHNHSDVKVTVRATLVSERLVIEVSDNGRGIDAQHMERIFDRYYRGNTSAVGSGIGLSLLKNLVQQTGGTLEVKSEKDKKTSFVLKF